MDAVARAHANAYAAHDESAAVAYEAVFRASLGDGDAAGCGGSVGSLVPLPPPAVGSPLSPSDLGVGPGVGRGSSDCGVAPVATLSLTASSSVQDALASYATAATAAAVRHARGDDAAGFDGDTVPGFSVNEDLMAQETAAAAVNAVLGGLDVAGEEAMLVRSLVPELHSAAGSVAGTGAGSISLRPETESRSPLGRTPPSSGAQVATAWNTLPALSLEPGTLAGHGLVLGSDAEASTCGSAAAVSATSMGPLLAALRGGPVPGGRSPASMEHLPAALRSRRRLRASSADVAAGLGMDFTEFGVAPRSGGGGGGGVRLAREEYRQSRFPSYADTEDDDDGYAAAAAAAAAAMAAATAGPTLAPTSSGLYPAVSHGGLRLFHVTAIDPPLVPGSSAVPGAKAVVSGIEDGSPMGGQDAQGVAACVNTAASGVVAVATGPALLYR